MYAGGSWQRQWSTCRWTEQANGEYLLDLDALITSERIVLGWDSSS